MVVRRPAARMDVAQFKALADAAPTLGDLGLVLTRAVEPFGVTTYAIGHLSGGGLPRTIYATTWPRAWMELYAANGFIADDPVVAGALATPEPFTMAELDRRVPLTTNRVALAARTFGFADGLVVPVHGPGDWIGVVALVGERLTMAPHERPALVEAARHAYDVAQRLFDGPEARLTLAPRERDALRLVAQGLDDAAIGKELGVTRASAHVYVERAKRRLGAATRAQAVAAAITERLL